MMKGNLKSNATIKTMNNPASQPSSNPPKSTPGEEDKGENPKILKLVQDLKNHSISSLSAKYNKQALFNLIKLSNLPAPIRTTKADLLQHLSENLLQKNKPLDKKKKPTTSPTNTQPPINKCPNPNCTVKTPPTSAHKCPGCNKFIHAVCGLETEKVHLVICPGCQSSNKISTSKRENPTTPTKTTQASSNSPSSPDHKRHKQVCKIMEDHPKWCSLKNDGSITVIGIKPSQMTLYESKLDPLLHNWTPTQLDIDLQDHNVVGLQEFLKPDMDVRNIQDPIQLINDLTKKLVDFHDINKYHIDWTAFYIMATTPCAQVPEAVISDNQIILSASNMLHCIWLASHWFFGAINVSDTKIVFQRNQATPLQPPLKYEKHANNVSDAIKAMKVSGFSKSDDIPIDTLLSHLAINENEKFNADDLLYAIMPKAMKPKTASRLWMWYKLAVTNPLELPGWKDDILLENKITILWDAATQFFGHRWNKMTVTFATEPTQHPSPPKQKSDASSINSNTTSYTDVSNKTDTTSKKSEDKQTLKALKHFVNKNFSCAIVTPKHKSSVHESKFKFATVLKFAAPVCTGPGKVYQQVQQSFAEIVKPLLEIVTRINMGILPFNPDNNVRTLEDNIPKDSAALLPWISAFDLTYDRNHKSYSYLRFRLGHDKDISEVFSEPTIIEFLNRTFTTLEIDEIQLPEREMIGFLLGPVPDRATLDQIHGPLKNKTIIVNNKIQFYLKSNLMRLDEKRMTPNTPKAQVVEIWAPKQQRAISQNVFEKLYPTHDRKTYVMGIRWTFLPNVLNTDLPLPPSSLHLCHILRKRQAELVENQQFHEYFGIPNINKTLPRMSWCHLHSMLMSLRSNRYPEEKLFSMVTQEHVDAPTKFFFTKKHEREARSIIPVLPLIMYKKLGAQSADWFTKNALDCLNSYSISDDGNTITSPKDNIFNKLFENWSPDYENAECNLKADGNTIHIGSFDILSFNEKVKTKITDTNIPLVPYDKDFDSQSTVVDDESSIGSSTTISSAPTLPPEGPVTKSSTLVIPSAVLAPKNNHPNLFNSTISLTKNTNRTPQPKW